MFVAGYASLRPILARMTWSLNLAFNQATPVARVRFQVTEVAADWKFLRDFFHLKTHWNALAAGGFCYFCRMKRNHAFDFPDVRWRTTTEFVNEVLEEGNPSPLLLLEAFDPSVLQWCELRNVNLGLLWTRSFGSKRRFRICVDPLPQVTKTVR